MAAKQDALVLVLLLCACPYSAMSVIRPTCANICHNYSKDNVNYQYCLIACKEASTSKAMLDNAGHSHPSQLPNYFQNGEDVPMESDFESELTDFYDPVEESHRDRGDYDGWSPTGSVPKQLSPVIWRKTMDSNPSEQGASFAGTGRPTLPLEEGKSRTSEVQKRASSFVRIGRALYHRNRGQARPLIQLGKELENDIVSDDPTLVLENGRPSFVFESGKPLMEEEERKRASSFVRIGRSHSDAHSNRAQGSLRRRPTNAGEKRVSSFVRIGRPHSDEGERQAATLEMDSMPNYANRVRKSVTGSKKKRASSFVRIGKSQVNEDDKRASSFVRIGKSQVIEDDKRASSFVRIGKSLVGEDDKRASSFVRIGKSLIGEDDKRASSFVRIGKSQIGSEDKRASSFVRVGKSPSEQENEEKRASSFVRIGKSPANEEEKRASSFVRVGKSLVDEEEKRASSFVRIGKSPIDKDDKRASSFVRIGKSPLYEEKRASSFVRIGKSPQDDENGSTYFSDIGKRRHSAQKRGVGSLLRRNNRAGSLTARAERTSQQDSDEFNVNRYNQGQRYSTYWRLRKPFLSNGDPNDRNLLRIPRPVIQSLLNQNARVTPLLSSRRANQELLWIPVNDDKQMHLGADDQVEDS